MQLNVKSIIKTPKCFDRGSKLHAIVGGGLSCASHQILNAIHDFEISPAARSGIGWTTGAIGVDHRNGLAQGGWVRGS